MSLGTPALSSTGGGGGGSSTITSFLGSTTNGPVNITQIGGNAVTTTIPVSGSVTANAGTGTFNIQSNASVNIAQVGGASFALGQQLAAASLPIVLTAAQLTTLTPPSNTGYALDSSLTTIDTDLKSNITLHAGTNTIGGVVPQPSASTTSLSISRQTALSNTAVAIKASLGRIYKLHFYNPNSTMAFVQFYDVAQASVSVGVTTPTWTWFVPAQGAYDDTLTIPIPAGTAITFAATTTVTGGTAPSTGLLAEIGYM